MRTVLRAAVATCLLLTLAHAAEAKSYKAELFDSRIRVLPGGALEITESIQFRFDAGPFTQVFREIPTRLTGGIEILRAEIDGEPVPFGEGRGRVEVRNQSNRVRVVWRFQPVEFTAKRFVLRYRVSDAVRRGDNGHDLLTWRATPGEHAYAIEETAIEYQLPAPIVGAPRVDVQRAPAPDVAADGTRVRIHVANVRQNGWIETRLEFPQGAIIASAPAWQQRQLRIQAGAGNWIVAAAFVFLSGLVLLFAWRQSYERPPGDVTGGTSAGTPPDTLSPAAAGALVSGGRVSIQQAMGALVSLAERGVLEIVEQPRGIFGQRSFTIRRRSTAAQLAPAEQGVLDGIALLAGGPQDTISLSRAQSKLARSLRLFRSGVEQELASHMLLDPERKALQRRYVWTGVVLLIAGLAALAPAALLAPTYGGWPILVAAAIVAVGIASFIFAGSITPLSNEGLRRRARWRSYRNHLRAFAEQRDASSMPNLSAALPFALALGAGMAWAKYLKKHPALAPAWFRAVSTADDGAFSAFIASSGAHASHGGGAAASGAGGGGASGAS